MMFNEAQISLTDTWPPSPAPPVTQRDPVPVDAGGVDAAPAGPRDR